MLIVYSVETAIATIFGWISQYVLSLSLTQIRCRDSNTFVYETGMRIPCVIWLSIMVACLSMAFISRSISKYLQGMYKRLIRFLAASLAYIRLHGYLFRLDVRGVLGVRTFVCKPEAWIHQTIQRLLGLIFMGSSILVVVVIFSVIRNDAGKFQRDSALLPILMISSAIFNPNISWHTWIN